MAWQTLWRGTLWRGILLNWASVVCVCVCVCVYVCACVCVCGGGQTNRKKEHNTTRMNNDTFKSKTDMTMICTNNSRLVLNFKPQWNILESVFTVTTHTHTHTHTDTHTHTKTHRHTTHTHSSRLLLDVSVEFLFAAAWPVVAVKGSLHQRCHNAAHTGLICTAVSLAIMFHPQPAGGSSNGDRWWVMPWTPLGRLERNHKTPRDNSKRWGIFVQKLKLPAKPMF